MTLIVERATDDNLADVIALDGAAIGGEGRAVYIAQVIRDHQCYIAREGWDVVGYAVLTQNFFRYYFIDLLIVHPDHRRKGVATALIHHFEKIFPHYKLFTSTNEYDSEAQALFEQLGFVKSGRVDNLDHGDSEIIYLRWPEERRAP